MSVFGGYALEQELLKVWGFAKGPRYGRYTHTCGLRVSIGDHRWDVEHLTEKWSEEGVLDETNELTAILREYIGGVKR